VDSWNFCTRNCASYYLPTASKAGSTICQSFPAEIVFFSDQAETFRSTGLFLMKVMAADFVANFYFHALATFGKNINHIFSIYNS
jgi:hypothetical protein